MNRLAQLQRPSGATASILPDLAEAKRLLEWLGVDEEDQVDVLAARPDADQHSALWWVLDRVYQDMQANMGVPVSIDGFPGYPELPASTGPLRRHLPVWTFLALVPAIRRFHKDKGVLDEISWPSLSFALVSALRAHREVMGVSGLGLWGFGWTLPVCFRGVGYRLGRLNYHLGEMSLSSGPCGYVLGVHIPEGERLDSDACRESMTRAQTFFASHFPEYPIACLTCESWLMDPQLAEYLGPDSNIVKFQQLYTIFPLLERQKATSRSDDVILGYVFRRAVDTSVGLDKQLDQLPQNTSLERAYVQHRRSGRHWYVRSGWRPVEENAGLDN